ncbi:transcription initiation factor TFIID subunit 8-like [Toxorhynchites rutilus septentrionalis]|uniref:transcription initiation factor TFIID subunit 8-like n=1 Tax=Toxorhynchites rutilus septentrionalis TaxID=329112 RepID=UPI0024798B12|nr:transcription initiation factor TFIID subunit 8-like [Toxorhynchites rutilus septentrionalis]
MAEFNATQMARRKFLQMAISSQLLEHDFDNADKECLETLTEMMQSFIVELGQSARNYCELAGRTQPVIGDVVIALINMGISVRGLESFAKREGRQILPQPQLAQAQKQPSILQAGQKNSHPTHIPNHLPSLPDPHAYIRTPTYKQPVTEYEAIREKAASQKRDIEKALTKFLAKTSEVHSLFDNEDNPMFPLIACKPSFPPYLQALNPTDQIFDFEELEYYYQVANRKEDPAETKEDDDDDDGEDGEGKRGDDKDTDGKDSESTSPIKSECHGAGGESKMGPPTVTVSTASGNITTAQINLTNNSPTIDNPYLRAATIPRKVKSEGASGLF